MLVWRAPNERTNPYPWQAAAAEQFDDGRLGPVTGFVLPAHTITVGPKSREADALLTEPDLRYGRPGEFIAARLVGDYSRANFQNDGIWLFQPGPGRCNLILDDRSLGADMPYITHYRYLPDGGILFDGIAEVGGPRAGKYNRLVWVGQIDAPQLRP